MNDHAPPPAAKAPPPSRPQVSGRDREFLPAALEILETPPPPLIVALAMTISLALAAALVWAYIGKLDVHAIAPGKFELIGRGKVIEPLDAGKIVAIRVTAGDRVKAGDVLFELDPAEAKADQQAAAAALGSGQAEIARRRAAIGLAQALQTQLRAGQVASAAQTLEAAATDADARIRWDAATPDDFRLREGAVLSADLLQLAATLATLDQQIAQKDATKKRLTMSIAFEETLVDTLNESVNVRRHSFEAGGAKINLFEAQENLQKSQASLASDQGQMIETAASLTELASEKIRAVSQFIADNQNKLVDAARKTDEARETLGKAEARLNRLNLTAPIDGVVQQLTVTTIGQVVTTGQQLATLVPSDGALQVEALVTNLDIGFVHVGQEAAIKVDAFPFTRYGVLRGKVERIAAAAVDEQTAKRGLADATAASSPINSASGSAPGQPPSFVFPVTISLEKTEMLIDGSPMKMAPGMTVTAEIKTDSRRVIEYLLSPLSRVTSEAGHER